MCLIYKSDIWNKFKLDTDNFLAFINDNISIYTSKVNRPI